MIGRPFQAVLPKNKGRRSWIILNRLISTLTPVFASFLRSAMTSPIAVSAPRLIVWRGKPCALAKDNHRLIPYLNAQFRLMNNAQGQLDAERGKEAALEAISYLESEERARVFQADFPEEEYRHTVAWMSACGYDNLAKHIASMQGYNSEGMHQCITDGIGVCRRTGKLRCLTCFREYATDVYLASDDVPMALHFARIVRSIPEDAPSSERRWVGAKDETWILTLQGYLAAAEESANRALEAGGGLSYPAGGKTHFLAASGDDSPDGGPASGFRHAVQRHACRDGASAWGMDRV